MKLKFSKDWKKSTQPRKQRKYRYNAPLNIKSKFMSSHLSKELKAKYNKRNIEVRKGDTVKVVRGQYKGKTGKVDRVSIKKTKAYCFAGHDSATPSLSFRTENNLWKCFGCGLGGSNIELVQNVLQLNKRESAEWLKVQFSICGGHNRQR